MNERDLAELRNQDLREKAFHEAGHFLAAKHFKLQAHVEVVDTGEAPTLESGSFEGTMTINLATTPFRSAVIAWAGPLAEALAAQGPEEWRCFLEMFYSLSVDSDFIGFSSADRAAILRHSMRRRAFKNCRGHLGKKPFGVGACSPGSERNAARADTARSNPSPVSALGPGWSRRC
jgi:hypothetical protein